LDLVAGRLVVRRTLWRDQEGTPKGGRIREVPLSNDAVTTLKAHRHLKGSHVFCEPDGSHLTHSRVKDVVPDTCKRAQLAKRLTTHDLRHTGDDTLFSQCRSHVRQVLDSARVRPVPPPSGRFRPRNGARMAAGTGVFVVRAR